MYSRDESQPNERVDRDDQQRGFTDDETKDLREANENVRKAQGDDAPDMQHKDRSGNRPRFDRDR